MMHSPLYSRASVFAGLICGTVLSLAPLQAAAEMATSRGYLDLAVKSDECIARARRAAQAQGVQTLTDAVGMLTGWKDDFIAAIVCANAPDPEQSVAHIFVVVKTGSGEKAGGLRVALQDEMNR
jgi:hypothetical protein